MSEQQDIITIQQLVCREREARDRCWWDEMRSVYAEDSWIDLSWFRGSGPEFIDQSEAMAKKGTPSKHQLGPIVVRVSQDGTRALATLSAIIKSRFAVNGVEVDIASEARLIYKVVKLPFARSSLLSSSSSSSSSFSATSIPTSDDSDAADGHRQQEDGHRWWLAGLDCIYESDTVTPAIPGQVVPINSDALSQYRPSYRCLSYFLSYKGHSVNQDLPGDDKPEQVKAKYDDAFVWLGNGKTAKINGHAMPEV